MKTNHIALTLLASTALMLSSCLNESEIKVGSGTLEQDEIGFKLGVIQVRSAVESEGLGTIQLGTVSTPQGSFILEDIVESLDNALPTRGTPAYTENVEALYGSFSAVGSGTKTIPDASYAFDGEEFWSHHFAGMGDLWPEGASYQFFMRMPGNVPGVKNGASGITNNSDGSMSFDYTSPSRNATGQTDILFTSKTVTQNGEDIVFYHALTGVKFANYFDNKGKEVKDENGNVTQKATTKTIIKKVNITGLKKTGHCVVNPSSDGDKSADKVTWTLQRDTMNFSQEFSKDFAVYGSEYSLDTKLEENGAKQNLNDANGTQTFWFVPQSLAKTETDSVMLTVIFDVEPVATILPTGETVQPYTDTLTVTLSNLLSDAHKTWEAGQLHTFTLRPTAVGVEINDDLTEYVKSDVVVENTGNVYEYVRVNIVGNWMGKVCINATSASEPEDDESLVLTYSDEDVILMGYPNNTKDDSGNYTAQKMLSPWNDKDFYSDGSYREIKATDMFMAPYTAYGTFVNLPYMADEPAEGQQAGPGGTVGNWIRHDKYYYYMLPIGPGDSVTEELFKSYTVGNSPAFWIADKWGTRRPALNVHLEMDLAVQAIECPVNAKNEPTKTYLEAWTAFLNPDNNPKFNINDL